MRCLDVTRAPVGPTARALLPGPTVGPGPGLGTQGLSGVRATTLVPTSERKRWPALPEGDGGALLQLHTQFKGSLSIQPDWVRQFEIDCLGCKARLPSQPI